MKGPFFMSTTSQPHVHRYLTSKEEVLTELAKRLDQAIENGCTYFDIIINTDMECTKKEEKQNG